MKRICKKELRLYVTNLLAGIALCLATLALPLMLKSKDIDNEVIASLIGVGFLGAFFQPFIGAAADLVPRPKYVIISAAIVNIFSIILLIYANTYTMMLIAVLLISISQSGVFGITNSVIAIICKEKNYNYGFIRSGASLGYGLGVLITTPFVLLFGETSIPIVNIIISLSLIILVAFMDDSYDKGTEVHYISEVKLMITNKLFLLILSIVIITYGLNGIKLSYQTLKAQELGVDYIYIAILSFVIIIPEIILMPKYDKLFSHLSVTKTFVIVILLFAFNTFILMISNNIYVIIMFALLHGLGSTLCIPKVTYAFRELLSAKIISTGFLLQAMLTSIFNFLVNLIILKPVYEKYGISGVFAQLTIGLLLGLIVTYFLYREEKKQHIHL